MFLVAAALVSSWLITVSEISTQIVDLLKPFMGNNTLLMFAIMVIVVIVGTGPRLELWSRDRWGEHRPELLSEVQEITASFNDTA